MKSLQTTADATWASTLIFLSALTGCAEKPSAPPKIIPPSETNKTSQQAAPSNTIAKEKKTVDITKLILSKPNSSQYMVRLGMLQFDDSKRATLTTEGSGPAVEKLKHDWSEVSSKPELIWKTSVPGVVDGENVTRIVGSTVHPGEDTYPAAVLNTMERSYGYSVEIGD